MNKALLRWRRSSLLWRARTAHAVFGDSAGSSSKK
jgi:hypothetical protein